MPNVSQQDDSLQNGLATLSATFQQLAKDKQEEANRALLKMQSQNAHLNAIAQLSQSIGLYGGEPQFNNEQLSKETGGLLQVKPKSSGTKMAETQAKLVEGQAKRDFAKTMSDAKFGQQMTLEQIKWAHSMSRIEQLAKTGDSQAAFKALMDHVKTFGTTGGAEDVARGQRAIGQAKNVPLTADQKPIDQTVGAATGGFMGFGSKTASHGDLIEALGSEARANQAEQDWNDIQSLIKSNPKSTSEWQTKFFKEYPVLQGKIGFTKE
jgi:hypothetical protein